MSEVIRVLVADDQELVRTGLSMILDAQPDIEMVGRAANGEQAVKLAQQLRPDVCLFDIRMPELDGIEATRLLAGPSIEQPLAVVIITTFDHDEYVCAALKAGARGFLLKDAGADLLIQAIRAAARGDALIAPSVTARLLSSFAQARAPETAMQPDEALTEREEEVLMTVARGLTNAEIATELHISLSTVRSHVASLMAKLDARNRVEVAIWASRRDGCADAPLLLVADAAPVVAQLIPRAVGVALAPHRDRGCRRGRPGRGCRWIDGGGVWVEFRRRLWRGGGGGRGRDGAAAQTDEECKNANGLHGFSLGCGVIFRVDNERLAG